MQLQMLITDSQLLPERLEAFQDDMLVDMLFISAPMRHRFACSSSTSGYGLRWKCRQTS